MRVAERRRPDGVAQPRSVLLITSLLVVAAGGLVLAASVFLTYTDANFVTSSRPATLVEERFGADDGCEVEAGEVVCWHRGVATAWELRELVAAVPGWAGPLDECTCYVFTGPAVLGSGIAQSAGALAVVAVGAAARRRSRAVGGALQIALTMLVGLVAVGVLYSGLQLQIAEYPVGAGYRVALGAVIVSVVGVATSLALSRSWDLHV